MQTSPSLIDAASGVSGHLSPSGVCVGESRERERRSVSGVDARSLVARGSRDRSVGGGVAVTTVPVGPMAVVAVVQVCWLLLVSSRYKTDGLACNFVCQFAFIIRLPSSSLLYLSSDHLPPPASRLVPSCRSPVSPTLLLSHRHRHRRVSPERNSSPASDLLISQSRLSSLYSLASLSLSLFPSPSPSASASLSLSLFSLPSRAA